MNKFFTPIFLVAMCLSLAYSKPYYGYDRFGLSSRGNMNPNMFEMMFASDNQLGNEMLQGLYAFDLNDFFSRIFGKTFPFGMNNVLYLEFLYIIAQGYNHASARNEYQPERESHRLKKRQDSD